MRILEPGRDMRGPLIEHRCAACDCVFEFREREARYAYPTFVVVVCPNCADSCEVEKPK